jgi:hypothetical protein
MSSHEPLKPLREAIRVGLEQVRQGQVTDGEEVFARIRE